MFGLKPDVILFSLEGKRVTGGVAEDYIKGNQKTAYLTILLDTSYSQPIRCFIKYANLLRTVTANPSAPMFRIGCFPRDGLAREIHFY